MLYPSQKAYLLGGDVILDAADEFVAHVFKVPKTGTLKKIGWRVRAVSGTSYTVKISLETVAETVGQPVATTNAGKTLYAASAESADITSISAGVIFTPINGASGISVTQGDQIAITIRLISASESSISVYCHTGYRNRGFAGTNERDCYTATYLGSTWAVNSYGAGFISLEYSDGFCPVLNVMPVGVSAAVTYNSGSSNNFYGIKFRYPFKCRLSAASILSDLDGDANIYLYDSDEYTAFSGFPVAVKNTQRLTATLGEHLVIFPVKSTLEANTWYRLVVAPSTTTNLTLYNTEFTSDGSYDSMNACFEGSDIVTTYRTAAPSSGDHAWTDSTTLKCCLGVVIDGIEASSGGTVGISRSRQLMG